MNTLYPERKKSFSGTALLAPHQVWPNQQLSHLTKLANCGQWVTPHKVKKKCSAAYSKGKTNQPKYTETSGTYSKPLMILVVVVISSHQSPSLGVTVSTVHKDSNVSAVGFEWQSKMWWKSSDELPQLWQWLQSVVTGAQLCQYSSCLS